MSVFQPLLDFWIKQGDTARALTMYCLNEDGTLIEEDITDCTVEFHMDVNGVALVAAGYVVDPDDKIVGYQWSDGDTDTPGDWPAEMQLTFLDNNVMTFPNTTNLTIHITPEIA